MNTPTASGLDGVVVADTALSHVDGEHGRLIVRGYSVEALVERATFEEACALLWNGLWPSTHERDGVRAALAEARAEAFAMLASLSGALVTPDSMEGVRAAVGHLRSGNAASDRVRLTGALPVFAAAWARGQANQLAAPQPLLSHAADCLQMLSGGVPAPACVRACARCVLVLRRRSRDECVNVHGTSRGINRV